MTVLKGLLNVSLMFNEQLKPRAFKEKLEILPNISAKIYLTYLNTAASVVGYISLCNLLPQHSKVILLMAQDLGPNTGSEPKPAAAPHPRLLLLGSMGIPW